MKTKKTKDEKVHSQSKYDIGMAFTMYELAKSGSSEEQIAGALGVHPKSIQNWKKQYKSVRMALKLGLALSKAKQTTDDFYDFVAGRLPEDLVDLWNELLEVDDDPNALRRLEKMIAMHGRKARQRLFLHALVHFNFDIGRACRFVNIQRATFNAWKTNDPDFFRLIEEVTEIKGDFYEHALVRLVRTGSVPAIIHANKTYNAKRGYSTKIDINVSGEVNHTHTMKVSQLELPLDVRVALLNAIKERKEELNQPPLLNRVEVLEAAQ